MTVWNDAQHTRRLAHATWMSNTAVLMHLNERATGDPARDWLSSWAHRWFVGNDLRVLVLGCGEGWLERVVAEWPFVARIDAVDFADEAVARARELARGIDKIRYGVIDLNRDELPEAAYDVVVAHSVLHHIENLEHAFDQLQRTMRPDATLIVNEYVGPKRFQFDDRVLHAIDALFRCIPADLRGTCVERVRPSVEEMIANDPTEAVRSDELMTFIEARFEVLERKEMGGTILQHLLYDIAENFRFDVPRERSLLEMLCAIEGMLVDRRLISSDFVILAARRKESQVNLMARPLPRRAAGAADIEGDPLRLAPRPRRRGPKGESLRRHHLRLLRVALLSARDRRANLFEESKTEELLERWAARNIDAWQWLVERSPADPAVRCLLETAAKLARA